MRDSADRRARSYGLWQEPLQRPRAGLAALCCSAPEQAEAPEVGHAPDRSQAPVLGHACMTLTGAQICRVEVRLVAPQEGGEKHTFDMISHNTRAPRKKLVAEGIKTEIYFGEPCPPPNTAMNA